MNSVVCSTGGSSSYSCSKSSFKSGATKGQDLKTTNNGTYQLWSVTDILELGLWCLMSQSVIINSLNKTMGVIWNRNCLPLASAWDHPGFNDGVHVAHLFSFLCYAFLLVFVLCIVPNVADVHGQSIINCFFGLFLRLFIS
jgi:hypothetical protein